MCPLHTLTVPTAYITAGPCHHDKGAGFFQAGSSSAYQHGVPGEEEDDEDDEPDSRDAISGAVCCMTVHLSDTHCTACLSAHVCTLCGDKAFVRDG